MNEFQQRRILGISSDGFFEQFYMKKHRSPVARYGILLLALYKDHGGRIRCLGLIALLGVTVVAMAARAVMNYNSDDNHFAMGAQLVADGYTPYVDFPYFQMPYASYIFGAVLKAQISAYKYLTLRLTNLAFCLAAIALIYVICLKLSQSRHVALGAVLLLSSSEFLNLAAEQLNSYAIANFFAILAFAVLILEGQSPARRALLSGVCLGLAMASKLYYALLAPPLLLFVIAPGLTVDRRRALQAGAVWFGGLILALTPAAVIAAMEPAAFWFDNYGYHILNSKYRDLSQSGAGMTIPAKFNFLAQMLGKPVYLSVGILAFIIFFYTYRHSLTPKINGIRLRDRTLLLAVGSFAFMLVAAMTPRPLWPSYFLAPLPFAIIALTCLYGIGNRTQALTHQHWHHHIFYASVFVSILSLPNNLYIVKRAINVDAWATVEIYKHGQRIRALIADQTHARKLLTFEGLYAMEGEVPFYRQMSGAAFAYRVGDMMDNDLRSRSSIVSTKNIRSMLDAAPPAGILLSNRFEKFNSKIISYATDQKYTEIDLHMPDHRFFARPIGDD